MPNTLRTDYETFFQLQNLMLIAQGMGLGAWIHAAVGAPYLFERDPANGKFGIEFRMQKPKKYSRWQRSPPLPTTIDNPIGIDGVLETLTPPYINTMDEAVDKVIEEKYGPQGTYGDHAIFDKAYKKREHGDAFLKMASRRPTPQAIELRPGDLHVHLRTCTDASRRTSTPFTSPASGCSSHTWNWSSTISTFDADLYHRAGGARSMWQPLGERAVPMNAVKTYRVMLGLSIISNLAVGVIIFDGRTRSPASRVSRKRFPRHGRATGACSCGRSTSCIFRAGGTLRRIAGRTGWASSSG